MEKESSGLVKTVTKKTKMEQKQRTHEKGLSLNKIHGILGSNKTTE